MSIVHPLTRRAGTAVVAVLLAVVAATGCATSARSGSDQPGVINPTGPPTAPAQRQSLAQSSIPDIAGTLRGAGVSDPEKWADILAQYRPYPTGQAGDDAIRAVLKQFQADPEDTQAILASVGP